jgi:hypothetical protein
MNLNIIGISIISLIFLFFGYFFWNLPGVDSIPPIPRFLVAVDTGKTHHIQSMTGDASMNTQLKRRRAIQSIGKQKGKFNALLGSASGVIETYFITGICSCPPKPCPDNSDIIFDGGDAIDEYCPIHGNNNYDAGGATTTVCNIPLRPDIIFSGGGASDEYCPIEGTDRYDGGTAETRVCDI